MLLWGIVLIVVDVGRPSPHRSPVFGPGLCKSGKGEGKQARIHAFVFSLFLNCM